ncbi:microfibrillar-associated protein 1 [Plakobranchus ocellatus]|uniref:Microfibrillar-associated protein 1 n=1 Tax=Plakobranchus ocellatus TaxID=259542 RepID=A0AAV4CEP4_9GAST|nr:microfibrillar-associated protein 1 [Plakobranchus ocellatus]
MKGKAPIMSTAGAIPVRNEKGELTMEKVKVTRYMRGQRPEFAPQSSSDEDEEEEVTTGFQTRVKPAPMEERPEDVEEEEAQAVQDRRLRRLQQRQMPESDDDEDDRTSIELGGSVLDPSHCLVALQRHYRPSPDFQALGQLDIAAFFCLNTRLACQRLTDLSENSFV